MVDKHRDFRTALCAVVVCALMGGGVARAQGAGALRGRVVTLSGEPIPGVTVTLTGGTLAAQGSGGVTDASGAFVFAAVPPGRDYVLKCAFPGLATVVVSEVEVAPGQARRLDVVMQKESDLRERVEVRARAAVVDPQSTTIETRFTSEFIDALPVLGRNYQDVLVLAPGVSDVDGDGNPNIHGARDTDVVTLLDGIATNDPLTGKVGAQLNIESIQEIEVKTAGATAEFSRAQGGFATVVTKSGGNDFQGTFKFFWRGSLLDGDGAGTDDPRLHAGVGDARLRDLTFNDFLPFLSAGGPIVRDRAWFFVALESIHKEDPVNVLSAAFVTGLREQRNFGKATWQASANHRLSLTVNHDPQEFLNQGLNSFTREETGFSLRQGGLLLSLKGVSVLSPLVAVETTVAHFEGRPDLIPNLGLDTNGNGVLFFDHNGNGFIEPSERDSGEDFDGDGAFDVFEDTIDRNHILDEKEVIFCNDAFGNPIQIPPHPGPCATQPNLVLIREDQDGDLRLTLPFGCEGRLREDHDCDGHLDRINEDFNRNGRLDPVEDRDGDGRLDPGTEDHDKDRQLDDRARPDSLDPYGRLRPEPADRDYTIDQLRGIVSGPYFEASDDVRGRVTLRQDLSLFAADLRGSHDVRLGFALERERFDRITDANDIVALKDPGYPVGRLLEQLLNPNVKLACNPYETPCEDPGVGRVFTLIPIDRSIGQGATGRSVGVYVHDTYKPVPSLSLGIGLRYDREVASSTGFAPFDPAAERALFGQINALGGGEAGGDDGPFGNLDGVTSRGIITDPLFADTPDPDLASGGLVQALRRAAAGRMTQHRTQLSFTLPALNSLFPGIVNQSGELNLDELAKLGVSIQQPQAFAISNDNLAPRLSLSWDPWADGRTKVFATWGRYYDKLFLSTVVGEQGIERLQRYYVFDRDGLTPGPSNAAIAPVALATPNHHIGRFISKAPPSTTQVERGLQTPFSDELTFGIEREIAPEMSLSVRYISRRFRDQLQDIDINHSVRIDPQTGEPTDQFGGFILPDPGETGAGTALQRSKDGRPDLYIHNFFFNEVLRVGNFNEARYRAVEVEAVKRLSRRWQMQSSYAYSRAIGAAEDFQSRLGNDPSTVEPEFGYLDFDQRHVVKLNAVMFLPRDWQMGVTASWASGLPYSVISRFFAADNVDYQQFRTRYGFTARGAGGAQRFEGMRRNSERNDAVYDINLSARKNLVIGRISAGLFFDVFNLLNTDDLWIFTFEPSRATGAIDPRGVASPVDTLQLDATRRFGRRYQVGLQFQF